MRAAVMLFEQLVVARQAIAIPSIVLQELLSGVRDEDAVGKLEAALGGYALLLPARDTHLLAAQLQRRCARKGVAAATVDCLIAAHAIETEASLFTVDDDFGRIAMHSDLQLLSL